MPFISWEDQFSVGVKDFDSEHQKLISFVNKLHVNMIGGEGPAIMSEILDNLVDYTVTHFGHEEELMIKYNYPDFEKHKNEHQNLIEKVDEFKNKLNAGNTSFTLELMSFLRDWLMNHIKGSDKMYTQFFNDKGIS